MTDGLSQQPFEPEMILISAGEFLMGSDPKKDKDTRDIERPQHTLYLPDYYLAKTPLTNTQYAAFVAAAGYETPRHWKGGEPPGGKEDHPVVNVSWHDAVAYCRWLAELTGKPYRLPTEAEWEKAARGTDARIYPWGDRWDETRCNSAEGGIGDTMSVEAYPKGASPYGLLDMAGNVWEWCATHRGKKYPFTVGDEWSDNYLSGESPRVLRGGAFFDLQRYVRGASRLRDTPNYRDHYVGFRLAMSL